MSNIIQFKQVKTQYDIQQFIAKYCKDRNIECTFIHDSVQIEEKYAKDLTEAVEKFLKE